MQDFTQCSPAHRPRKNATTGGKWTRELSLCAATPELTQASRERGSHWSGARPSGNWAAERKKMMCGGRRGRGRGHSAAWEDQDMSNLIGH
jgi:hypothetical protein